MMNRYLTSVFPKIPFNTVSCFVLLSIIFYSSAITAEQPTLLGDVEVRIESVGDQVRLTAVDTPDGMITYGYDNDGRLSSLTYPDHGFTDFLNQIRMLVLHKQAT